MTIRPADRNSCQTVLLQELNHRIANTLALASAQLRLELRRAGDLDVRGVLSRHERLLADFGALHRCLAIGAVGGAVSLGEYFPAFCELLCRTVLAPVGAHCELAVADIRLDAGCCEMLALIVTELVMNAAKHAFGDKAGGVVRIAIDGGSDGIVCRILDNGRGCTLMHSGMGSNILSGLVGHMEGHLASRSSSAGSEFIVWLPRHGLQDLTVSSQS